MSAEEIHLPQAVARVQIPEGSSRIRPALSVEVRDAVIVDEDFDRLSEAFQVHGVRSKCSAGHPKHANYQSAVRPSRLITSPLSSLDGDVEFFVSTSRPSHDTQLHRRTRVSKHSRCQPAWRRGLQKNLKNGNMDNMGVVNKIREIYRFWRLCCRLRILDHGNLAKGAAE